MPWKWETTRECCLECVFVCVLYSFPSSFFDSLVISFVYCVVTLTTMMRWERKEDHHQRETTSCVSRCVSPCQIIERERSMCVISPRRTSRESIPMCVSSLAHYSSTVVTDSISCGHVSLLLHLVERCLTSLISLVFDICLTIFFSWYLNWLYLIFLLTSFRHRLWSLIHWLIIASRSDTPRHTWRKRASLKCHHYLVSSVMER